MTKWTDSTSHPIKRKLRWVLLIIMWILVALAVLAAGVFFYQNPRVFLVILGMIGLACLSELLNWVIEDDEPKKGYGRGVSQSDHGITYQG